MRDPQRIRPLLVRLLWAWQACPDLRLGQLMTNAVDVDLFFIEDDKLLQDIETFVSQNEVKQ